MKNGNNFSKSHVIEDHYSLIKEPVSEYVEHVSSTSGESATIFIAIYENFLK